MQRHPKRGPGYRWTVKELESVPPEWKGDVLADGDGVRLSGVGVLVAWRFAYKWEGKVKRFYCGSWPAVSMETIRASRDEAREAVKRGVMPADQKKADLVAARRVVADTLALEAKGRTENLRVADLAAAWIQDGVRRSDENAEIIRIMDKDVLPLTGKIPVRDLSERDLLSVLRGVASRDANRQTVVTDGLLRQMLRWAERRKPWRALLIEGNPADLVDVSRVVAIDYDMDNIRTRVLSDAELVELRDKFVAMSRAYDAAPDKRRAKRPVGAVVQLAAWICLGTLTRIGETMKARWEDVDLEAGTWRIPKENVKRTKAGQREHRVHLSAFALAAFRHLHQVTGAGPWCFPGRPRRDGSVIHLDSNTVSKQVNDRQSSFASAASQQAKRSRDDGLVLAGGKQGIWTFHDLRRTGATLMETLRVDDKIIDLCQNHVIHRGRDKIRRHYLHGDNGPRMRAAWDDLGEHLTKLLGDPAGWLPKTAVNVDQCKVLD